ncbi:MAG: amidohydrolase family protein [Solirubrobacterales bacterium]|nr:amidohydrolase family protein [Solirubrobacterales bacterium]
MSAAPQADAGILVRGGQILEAGGSSRRADVLVRDGVIAEVGDLERDGTPEIDAGGDYVVPGLINSHYHSAENFNPGLYENLPLDLWFLHSHQVTRAEPPSAETIYARTMLGAMQMLRTGTTSVVDFVFEAPEITVETLEPIVRAYRDAGLRATILLGVADKPFADSLPLEPGERAAWTDEAEAPSLERIMDTGRAAIERWHDPDGLIAIGFGPSAPQRCTEALFERTLELSRARGLAWQTHVLETRTQALTARKWHRGSSFVEVLDERGMLGDHASLVHMVWLSDADIETMARTRTTAVHCPFSNMRLGDGIARLPALRRAGVRVGLGTDGRGCDETLDMLELARVTTLLHKVRGEHHALWPTADDALSMLTGEASICTGRGERLGRIEPGAHGDLLVVRGDGITFTPVHDPVRQLLYGGSAADLRHVIVGGQVTVADGRLRTVDEREMLALARERAAAEMPHLRGRDGAPELERVVEDVYQRAEAAPLEVNAYIPG